MLVNTVASLMAIMHIRMEFLTDQTTSLDELPERTTCEWNCQKYRGGVVARRHVAKAAIADGGHRGRQRRWRLPCPACQLWCHPPRSGRREERPPSPVAALSTWRKAAVAGGGLGRRGERPPSPVAALLDREQRSQPVTPVLTRCAGWPPPALAASVAAVGYGGLRHVSPGHDAATVLLAIPLAGGLFCQFIR